MFGSLPALTRTARSRILAAAGLTILAVLVVVLFAHGRQTDGVSSSTTGQQAADAVNAGLTAQVAGRTAEAVADYQKALSLDPKSSLAYYNLGLIDQLAKRDAAAEANYRSALVIDPNLANALYNLAILKTKTAPLEAVDLYRHITTMAPTSAAPHLNLGYVLRSLGRTDEGNAEIARAIAIDPRLANQTPAATVASPTP